MRQVIYYISFISLPELFLFLSVLVIIFLCALFWIFFVSFYFALLL